MKILAIETSCDETAAAVLDVKNEHDIKINSNIISSQVKLHAKYGGVVPNLASREHVRNLPKVIKSALKNAGIKNLGKEIDLIAVTRGPGLGPSLLVGISFAKTIAWKYEKLLIGVDHMDGHVHSNWLEPDRPLKNIFPALNLIVSGGHTEMVIMRGHGKYKIIGETLDDAVGEAFDKAARLLGLGYPGGPIISRLAEKGDADRYPLPKPMASSRDCNFSYSGLKTAVLYLLRDISKGSPSIHSGRYPVSVQQKRDIAASFQKAALEVLVEKTIRAARQYRVRALLLSGGVSANKMLRERLAQESAEISVPFFCPKMVHTTDNAAMIGVAGYFAALELNQNKLFWKSVKMDANLTL